MKDKRYRLNYGESHEDITIADDEERVYLHGYQVDRLNEYDEKCKIMESKLKELGYELVFIREDYSMEEKKFNNHVVKNPGSNDAGEWAVIPVEEWNKIKSNDVD